MPPVGKQRPHCVPDCGFNLQATEGPFSWGAADLADPRMRARPSSWPLWRVFQFPRLGSEPDLSVLLLYMPPRGGGVAETPGPGTSLFFFTPLLHFYPETQREVLASVPGKGVDRWREWVSMRTSRLKAGQKEQGPCIPHPRRCTRTEGGQRFESFF